MVNFRSTPALSQVALHRSYAHVKHLVPLKRIAEALILAANADTEVEDYENAYISYTQAVNIFDVLIPSLDEFKECTKNSEIARYFELATPKARRKQARIGRILDDPLLPKSFKDEQPPSISQQAGSETKTTDQQPRHSTEPNVEHPPPLADPDRTRRREFGRYLKKSEEVRIQEEMEENHARQAVELMARLQAEEAERRRVADEKLRKRESVQRRGRLIEEAEKAKKAQEIRRQSASGRSRKSSISTTQLRVHFEPTTPNLPEEETDVEAKPKPIVPPSPSDSELKHVLRHGQYQQTQRQRNMRRRPVLQRNEWSHSTSSTSSAPTYSPPGNSTSIHAPSPNPANPFSFFPVPEKATTAAIPLSNTRSNPVTLSNPKPVPSFPPFFVPKISTRLPPIPQGSSSEGEETPGHVDDDDDDDEDEDENDHQASEKPTTPQEERQQVQCIDGTFDYYPATVGAIDVGTTIHALLETGGAEGSSTGGQETIDALAQRLFNAAGGDWPNKQQVKPPVIHVTPVSTTVRPLASSSTTTAALPSVSPTNTLFWKPPTMQDRDRLP